jgi:hypothetical protein
VRPRTVPNADALPPAQAKLGICVPQAGAAREQQARLERLCGISRGPGCGTLLLYCRPRLFELYL